MTCKPPFWPSLGVFGDPELWILMSVGQWENPEEGLVLTSNYICFHGFPADFYGLPWFSCRFSHQFWDDGIPTMPFTKGALGAALPSVALAATLIMSRSRRCHGSLRGCWLISPQTKTFCEHYSGQQTLGSSMLNLQSDLDPGR